MDRSTKVRDFMTPIDQMIVAGKDTTLQQANDIIWEKKLNTLPIVDDEGRLLYMVFRKDYATHRNIPWSCWTAKSVTS